MQPRILVSGDDFSVADELARLNLPGTGGIGSFIGTVRPQPGLVALHLEHYPGMTERALAKIAGQAMARWPLLGCTIIHRIGTLSVGANIVFTAAASAHRAAALEATAFLIDWLKTDAPFWKREDFATGPAGWVQARESDTARAQSWQPPKA